MKKILLVNGWSDDNKGDCAIVEGLITKIKKIDPTCSINMSSSMELDGFSEKYHYRHTSEVDNFSTSTFIKKSGKIIKIINFLYSFFLLLFPNLHKSNVYKKILGLFCSKIYCEHLKFFYEADVVISKGGHILVANKGVLGLVTLYKNIYPILLSIRLKKKVVIFSQSIGPFESKLSRKLAKYVFNRLEHIYCRERKSFELARSLMSNDRVSLTWDTAFAVEPKKESFSDINDIEDKKYYGLTIRRWDFANNSSKKGTGYQEYINSIVESIKYLKNNFNLEPLIIPQVTGPIDFEDDRTVVEELKNRLSQEGVVANYLNGDYSPSELSAIYGKCKFIIGTRFHSVILSLVSGTPAIAISYYGYKTIGIMEMFDLSEYVIDINDMDFNKIKLKLDNINLNIPEKEEKIKAKVNVANQIIEDALKCTLKM